MENATTLQITLTPDRSGALRAATAPAHAFGSVLDRLDPAVRQELAAAEAAVLRFLRADPKNAQAFAKDPVGTLRAAVHLSDKAVAAINASRAQSAQQFPGVPGTTVDRITVTVENDA